jgi:hypothetical protein
MINKSPWSMGKNSVQDIVRAVQQGVPPPVYPPLNEEQEAVRELIEQEA